MVNSAWGPEAGDLFLRQVFTIRQDDGRSDIVDSWLAQCVAEGFKRPSARTGGYCRARQRLPEQMVTAIAPHRFSGRKSHLLMATPLISRRGVAHQSGYSPGLQVSPPATPFFRR